MVDPKTGIRNNLLRIKKAKVVGVYHPLIDGKLVSILRRYELQSSTFGDGISFKKVRN